MARTILIDNVTRIEGHGKITINLDDSGEVADARFHVTQFRGFEKFAQGRPFWEMPSLMARTCGICPVSHLVASAKACDELLAVRIPRVAADLRRIMNLAQILQSHALSFFYLSSPDLVMGFDADPARRHILGVAQDSPQLAADGVKLRSIGQKIIEILGGKRIHPAWVVPGGVNDPLSVDERDRILALLPDGFAIMKRTLAWFKGAVDKFQEQIQTFGNFPSLYMSMVASGRLEARKGELALYEGWLRFTNENGEIIRDDVDPRRYGEVLGEAVEESSYLKSPYYKPLGYPDGMYRVGPQARLNNIIGTGEPLSNVEFMEYREMYRNSLNSSFHNHHARLVEMLFCLEKIQHLLHTPHIMDAHCRAVAEPNQFEGVGVSEAPRGTLFHHYRIDEKGIIQWVNMIIATGNNSLAMNRSVTQVAREYVKADRLQEGMLNRVEAVIRCYDPCLSCSTHAMGRMPLDITLLAADGRVLDNLRRDA